jgi:hypothetical protein
VKWARWQTLSPLALYERLSSDVYSGAAAYAQALYSIDQYLSDNPFADDRNFQEALGDHFLLELYGGSTLARDMAQGEGFLAEQELWLAGDSSWGLLTPGLSGEIPADGWVFVQDGTDLPSAAQWQDYLDQKASLGDDYGAIRTLLGLGTAAEVLDDPDLWLGNAEYIGRLLDSYQREIGADLAERQTLAADLLSILEVSLLGQEQTDLFGLADTAQQDELLRQYLQEWTVDDWRNLDDKAGELYLRTQLEKNIAAALEHLRTEDPQANFSEDQLQTHIVDWKTLSLYAADLDQQVAYLRIATGLSEGLGFIQGDSQDYREGLLGLLRDEMEVWGLDHDADYPGAQETRRAYALGLFAGVADIEADPQELGRWLLSSLELEAEDDTLLVIASGDETAIYQSLFGNDPDLLDFVIKDAVVRQGWDMDEVISRFEVNPDAELEEFIRLAGISSRYLPGIDQGVADYWDREYGVEMSREAELGALQAAGYQGAWVDEYFFSQALGMQLSPEELLLGFTLTGARLAENVGNLYTGQHGQGGLLDILLQENIEASRISSVSSRMSSPASAPTGSTPLSWRPCSGEWTPMTSTPAGVTT